jgi:hypothetical protein
VKLEAVYLQRDGFVLELLHYAAPGVTGDRAPRAMNALGLTHLSLRVADIDRVVQQLAAAGGQRSSPLASTIRGSARARSSCSIPTARASSSWNHGLLA